MKKITIGVEGMTCGHCVETVEKVLGNLEGVEKIVVNLPKEQVFIEFNDSKIRIESIYVKIKEAGFGIPV
tara:strand:- start:897 stop:1106 length:210 start_codon:yes stop_codon:yes gene_type:complete